MPFAVLAGVWLAWKILGRLLAISAHSGWLRELLDGAKFVLPIQSKVTRALAAAKFCRALGALYAAGMGAGKMIDIAASACGNAAFAARVRKIIPVLQNGGEMTAALSSTRQFPAIAIQMLHTGEASGRIDEQLGKVADFLEADAETALKQAVKVLGIVVFLGVAIYVGSIIIGQYAGTINGIMDDADKFSQ
jgi:type II secretory pathway component PulF